LSEFAVMFPGQGAQYVGMGEDLIRECKQSRDVFDRASSALGWDVAKLCCEGPEEKLNLTEYTQPALLTLSVAVWKQLRKRGMPTPHRAAGLSLGEYSALVAAGVLSFEDACQLVYKRGRYMQQAVPEGVGGMAAVIGMQPEEVQQVCRQVEGENQGVVRAANYNCPGQVVITGHSDEVEQASEVLRQRGAQRVIPLSVSAPFHSPMMQPAADKLQVAFEAVEFCPARFPVLSNASGEEMTDPDEIRELLLEQVYSPVLWEQSVRSMINTGCRTFVEVGPGDVLTGFLRRIDRQMRCLRCDKPQEIDEVVEEL